MYKASPVARIIISGLIAWALTSALAYIFGITIETGRQAMAHALLVFALSFPISAWLISGGE